MSNRYFSKLLFPLMLVLILMIAACGGDGADEEDKDKEDGDDLYSIEDFSPDKTNAGDPIDGGILQYGLVSDTVFEGVLNPVFYQGNPDFEVMKFFDEGLLAIEDTNFTFTQDGAAEWELIENDDDTVTFQFKIRDNVNWHDGEPVKAEDLAFAYEVIADPEYTGIRQYFLENVVGAAEYTKGEADEISGLEIVDEKTLNITYTQGNPSLMGGGVWDSPLPKHIFGDIPVPEMAESDHVRVNPIGFGPFIVDTVVPGESVTFTANKDYWKGEPKLDGITLKVVSPQTVAQALETGEVDLVDNFPADQYPDVVDKLTNVEFLGQTDLAYTYIGFKLGTFNKESGEVEMNPDAKMADVELRRAMWYAVDNDAVGERFYNGLRWSGTTLIIPPFSEYHDDTIETPKFDPDEANRILDEAGYIDQDDDGFRETPDGEELVMNFASMSGGDVAEPIANYYIQAWGNVGLNVQLLNGRLLEFNAFYDALENDDPDVDVYQGAWGTGTDVDQTGLYSRTAGFNYSRYASEKNDELLAAGASPEAMELEYRQDIYKQWQQLMVDDIPVFPTLYRAALVPANERVTDVSIRTGWADWHEVGLTQEEPVLP